MPINTIQQPFDDSTSPIAVLKKTLDAQALRQRAHAQNISNAETPNYKRVAVDFEELLKEATDQSAPGHLKRNDPRHLPSSGLNLEGLKPQIRQEVPDPNSTGLNGVDIDKEMAEMAETQIRYLTALELLKRRYMGIKSVIRGQP